MMEARLKEKKDLDFIASFFDVNVRFLEDLRPYRLERIAHYQAHGYHADENEEAEDAFWEEVARGFAQNAGHDI